jgi:hypothetical protein
MHYRNAALYGLFLLFVIFPSLCLRPIGAQQLSSIGTEVDEFTDLESIRQQFQSFEVDTKLFFDALLNG